MWRLDAIVEHNMTPIEAKAVKIGMLWMKLSKEVFPDYNHMRVKKGDPRKSALFRYCYKLIKETKGLLADDEYKLYIKAQLDVLKTITDGQVNAMITPNVIVGEKAWKRWLVWKKRYDKKALASNTKEAGVKSHKDSHTINELEKTKKFFLRIFENDLKKEDVIEAIENHTMTRWLIQGKVSPYYAVLSPLMKKYFKDESKVNFNIPFYSGGITEPVEAEYRSLFNYEFG